MVSLALWQTWYTVSVATKGAQSVSWCWDAAPAAQRACMARGRAPPVAQTRSSPSARARAAAGWAEANVAFMRSGGYSLSARVRAVAQRTLLLWGRHDEIVEPKLAQRYLQDIPDCRCGGRASAAMRP